MLETTLSADTGAETPDLLEVNSYACIYANLRATVDMSYFYSEEYTAELMNFTYGRCM